MKLSQRTPYLCCLQLLHGCMFFSLAAVDLRLVGMSVEVMSVLTVAKSGEGPLSPCLRVGGLVLCAVES